MREVTKLEKLFTQLCCKSCKCKSNIVLTYCATVAPVFQNDCNWGQFSAEIFSKFQELFCQIPRLIVTNFYGLYMNSGTCSLKNFCN